VWTFKPKEIAISDWSAVPLTEKQIVYSARDAWAGAATAEKLAKYDPDMFSHESLVLSLPETEPTISELVAKQRRRDRAKRDLRRLLAPYPEKFSKSAWADQDPSDRTPTQFSSRELFGRARGARYLDFGLYIAFYVLKKNRNHSVRNLFPIVFVLLSECFSSYVRMATRTRQTPMGMTPQKEPILRGKPQKFGIIAAYMGCRTTAYGPVVTSFWPGCTWTTLAANLLTRKTHTTTANETQSMSCMDDPPSAAVQYISFWLFIKKKNRYR
jgi:hypothetical protein